MGSRHDDQIWGDDGRNVLRGREGEDRLTGRDGNDILMGGAGADVLDGGNGFDVADYRDSGGRVFVNLSDRKAESGGEAAGDVLNSIEHVWGSSAADRLIGNAANNTLDGKSGNDELWGYASNDTLRGDAGNDRLYGGRGNDRLDGGKGNDVLTGDGGRDTFVFRGADGVDRITDFANGFDGISILSGASAFGQLAISQVGDDAVIRFASSVVVLEDFDAALLDANDFNFGRSAATKPPVAVDAGADAFDWMASRSAEDLL
ncbi:MAG: calcium-binding protein [Pseudomonadota bacterium]